MVSVLWLGCEQQSNPKEIISDKPDAPVFNIIEHENVLEQLVVIWKRTDGARRYQVAITESESIGFVPDSGSGIIYSRDIITHTFKQLNNDTIYFIWLAVETDKGWSDWTMMEGKTQKKGDYIPDKPRSLTVTVNSLQVCQFDISWDATENAEKYRLEYGYNNNFNNSREINAPATSISVIDFDTFFNKAAKTGRECVFRIYAIGNEGSALSDVVIKTYQLPEVVDHQVVPGNAGQLIVSWTYLIGARHYNIRWHTQNLSNPDPAPGSADTFNSPEGTTQWKITGLTSGVDYHVWVQACILDLDWTSGPWSLLIVKAP
jgi:hypothetical protein